MGLPELYERYKQEARAFRALLTDAEGQHVYPMLAPDGSLRYIVLHMPEGEWDPVELLDRVKLLLVHLAGCARANKDSGAATVLERCASMLAAVVSYHNKKEGR